MSGDTLSGYLYVNVPVDLSIYFITDIWWTFIMRKQLPVRSCQAHTFNASNKTDNVFWLMTISTDTKYTYTCVCVRVCI